MIVIEAKEAALPKVIKAFHAAGVSYVIEPLPSGDYSNTKKTFVVEKKDTDFWASIVDGRIDVQPAEMYCDWSDNRYLFVPSDSFPLAVKERKAKRDFHSRPWIYSKFGQVENLEVQIREYTDLKDFALKLQSLDQHLGEEKVLRERRTKLPKSIRDNQRVLMSFPGVGKKTAADWLKEMKTLNNIFRDIIDSDGLKSNAVKGIKGGKRPGKIVLGMKTILT